ncbi:CRISPR system precrRNA processing endoribonuclease RAMP protein Cas6 [Diplocloster agilis]|uniref:CRISPR system precrRNA processing endoribonuclease RAMP protein Cas6 n=1 Tax=Diplocloster agilis TaxID=2850323 RepID=A0A949N9J5_9FIRM|nr:MULTISPECIES: CRISPR system precrRNA processing endoribonuclease RAMP protein Cas6 [Lachnospiraceae]MBU9735437.1 CRISPR system precrRNA processing endoribonuclease RAMP protein Cas6 [Diplocloster agilis]MCU6732983.1 CRISPR system precrRNA processing endoribonuclease RAMP protein Cas6 [Suonthocola fibrivorans]SCI71394.1 CRISPR-associated endoribonuclease Cas6 [uncultured Clostridium sp.]
MAKKFTVEWEYKGEVDVNPGYAFYGFLSNKLNSEMSELLHQQKRVMMSQYVKYDNRMHRAVWMLSCFDDKLEQQIDDMLNGGKADIRGKEFHMVQKKEEIIPGQREIFFEAGMRYGEARQYRIYFNSPTTFKQNGEYVLFPTAELIMQSLIMHWNHIFPNVPVNDEDAVRQILGGTKITAYKLESSYYPMKNMFTKGFRGYVMIKLYLPEPLRILAQALLYFGNWCGVGAKTALGMGGVCVERIRGKD